MPPVSFEVELSLAGQTSAVTVISGQTTPRQLIPQGSPLFRSALVALVDGEPWDLNRPLISPSASASLRVQIVDYAHSLGRHTFWHSAAHVLGQALEFHYRPSAVRLSDGPPLADGGFFYDVLVQDRADKAVAVS